MSTRRLAWSLLALAMAMIAATVVLEALNHRLTGEDAASSYAAAVIALTFTVMGALIAARRPDNAIGWIFCAVGLLQALNLFASAYARYAAVTAPGSLPGAEVLAWIAAWCWMPSLALLITFLLLLFPDGHVPSRRWRWVAWTTGAAIALTAGLFAASLWPHRHELALDAEADVSGESDLLISLGFAAIVLGAVASAASLVIRFRRSTGVERQQLKWFAYAGVFVIVAVASAFGPAGTVPEVLLEIGVLAIPVTTGIAILRYRLYDIDVVIRRTLVYAGLTATLGATYLAIVLLAGLAVGQSDVAVAASTLAVAALFRPARARVQAAVDRRFYRRRYDAARTLEAFGIRLRHQVDLDALGADLAAVVRDTVQPAHVSLWLRERT